MWIGHTLKPDDLHDQKIMKDLVYFKDADTAVSRVQELKKSESILTNFKRATQLCLFVDDFPDEAEDDTYFHP